ncbi:MULTISPECIES: hypothetical protein [Flavobacterium]|jgi:hypothetical protein|uniref:Uncharacterized protein n=1 Tax=Flavobacterium hydatis TaxID=991 RepID=A0A086AS45_FLAHY|nr:MULTISPECIES: hypothetical protein [Flavobacterium]KIC02376.1 hypothetical protein OA88_08890 [Flavobacterium sp. JRM]KFF19509.1 hypothetical protein IW20_03250 [Flavobacterium hydatis]KIA97676.1 hypothetical protein OA93_11800 [Flavobacterium sp. KMS]MEA9413621.1 hypothetical protein [Flavobacterium sp. PL02]OUL61526.1 hypothetical protein B8T70_15065 [Flavobacterium sp. AJR]
MKGKIIFLSIFLMLSTEVVSSQAKNAPQSIISTTALIRKYHDQKELKGMQKGELLELYIERIKVLVKTLPYIALATKPGVTMADLGIPMDSENKKIQDAQVASTNSFLDVTVEFQRKMMPYSDKDNLVAAILFYENTLKTLHLFNENNE